MNTIDIGNTSKGKRIWIQGLQGKGITGPRFTVVQHAGTMVVKFGPHEKRKVTQAKGGIVDIVGKSVTQWAGDSTQADVRIDTATQLVTITRI